jgi:threonine aldolase
LALHLDGARLWNALIARPETALDYGRIFDSISICLSKGLGCPVGSLLLGKREFIRKARRIRKVFGGGMRQAGFLAAAGQYALKNHIRRLAVDHANASRLGEILAGRPVVKQVLPVETNIVIFELGSELPATTCVANLEKQDILSYAITPTRVRLVLHLDITTAMIDRASEVFSKL